MVPAPRSRVWSFVSTPEQIVECIPGMVESRIDPDKKIAAKTKIGVGFIKATFNITSRVVEEDAARTHAKLRVEGSGGASAFDADITIDLSDAAGQTELVWSAEARVSGPLGSVAKGLIESQAEKMITEIIDCVTKKTSA